MERGVGKEWKHIQPSVQVFIYIHTYLMENVDHQLTPKTTVGICWLSAQCGIPCEVCDEQLVDGYSEDNIASWGVNRRTERFVSMEWVVAVGCRVFDVD